MLCGQASGGGEAREDDLPVDVSCSLSSGTAAGDDGRTGGGGERGLGGVGVSFFRSESRMAERVVEVDHGRI